MPSSFRKRRIGSGRFNSLLVTTAKSLLWIIFRMIECALSFFCLLVGTNRGTMGGNSRNRNNRRQHKPKTTTVAIVGGNFAGLAALRELQSLWQNKSLFANGTVDHRLRIVLIDKRDYSEYTPGILRLFCDPNYFFRLAQPLPGEAVMDDEYDSDDQYRGGCRCSLERIKGTVTSLVRGQQGEKDGIPQKVLTYVPSENYENDPNDGAQSDSFDIEDRLVQPLQTLSSSMEKELRYDYLILATGATYNEPISPAAATPRESTSPTSTLNGRYQEWKKSHERLRSARSVLVLGGGAVGVELAAEILDHNDASNNNHKISVTLLDAQPTLVPLFPPSVGAYAEEWLIQKGATLRLGESLRSWNDRSCTLQDGTILQADVVYVCFGSRPNSQMTKLSSSATTSNTNNSSSGNTTTANGLFSLTRRGDVEVTNTLQIVLNNKTDESQDTLSLPLNTPWFACGDVSCPPTNNEKQAFQAEMQGKLAARNVMKLIESSSSTNNNHSHSQLLRYPTDIASADRIPLVFVLSLGRYDGVLGFNNLTISGPLAAIVKWILEHTKVSQMRGRLLGNWIWKFGDAVTLFLSRTLLRTPLPGDTTKPRDSNTLTIITSSPSASSLVAPHQRHAHRQLEAQLKLS